MCACASVCVYIYNVCFTLHDCFSSVQFSCSVVSDSLRPHGLQHARPPCWSTTPSSLKLMSIESVMPSNNLILCRPLLLPPSIFPSVRVFQMSQFFVSGGQSIRVSASALPMNQFSSVHFSHSVMSDSLWTHES